MKDHESRLRDAGERERAWARHLAKSGNLPADVTEEDLLAHGVYDASRDAIVLTVKGVAMTFPVTRP